MHYIRFAVSVALKPIKFVWTLCQVALGHLRRLRSHVKKTWVGADPQAQSTFEAVYVHYDREGIIHDYVVEQLRKLVEAGFRITFVTSSPKLVGSSVEQVIPLCRQLLWRRNVGYDFGGYKDGIRAIVNLDRISRLLLMNDSVYGPFEGLDQALQLIDAANTDFWGITDSWQQNYHVQSYFVLFLKGALQSPEFHKFWRRYPYVNKKDWVIKNGEIRLTQVLTQHKLRVSVLASYWDVVRVILRKLESRNETNLPPAHKDYLADLHAQLIRGQRMNPSYHFWDTLITEFNCPFIKREAILANRGDLLYNWCWPEIISGTSEYDLELIRRHIQAWVS